ncbi:tetratricopeptide repeat protein [Kordia sp. YSTF-M3]|uniref:Tetratricopeptide repeat protein n=1 Tax=Kordia aestuariivivens TaxID=2759037 RepID=A0ABR7Q5B6_9FLAO|nr:tetratricopeptide repeat protein [Kordia aestuariivivens]MBC8753760.1 tetratricopeptide repeat protein [Kordia aestuariivivens]
MATYKKRGYKVKTKEEKGKEVSAEDIDSTTAEVFNTLDETASKTEEWVAANQKYIFIGIGAIAVVLLGYLVYSKVFSAPKEAEAANEVFQANSYFNQAINVNVNDEVLNGLATRDSLFTLALNGGDGKFGYLNIISNYSGTNAANLANYSAGIAYLNLNKYELAIKHLQAFDSSDIIIGAKAKGAIGDAFAQLGQQAEALEYYEKAFKHSKNDATTPIFLLKAGMTALDLGNGSKALEYFNRIESEYTSFKSTADGKMLDAYIGKAEALK